MDIIAVIARWRARFAKVSEFEKRAKAARYLGSIANDNARRRKAETTAQLVKEIGFVKGPSRWRGIL